MNLKTNQNNMRMIIVFNKFFKTTFLLFAAGSLALATGCSTESNETSAQKPKIIVGAYPFQYAAEAIAGDNAQVTNLLNPGTDAHDLELTAKQVSAVKDADLVVYQSKLQSALDDAVAQQSPKHVLDTAVFLKLRLANNADHEHEEEHSEDHDHADHDHADHKDSAEHTDHDHSEHEESDEHGEHDHGKYDPHVWLNPMNVSEIGQHIAEELSKIDPEHSESYKNNASALSESMSELDGEFSAGLQSCKIDTFVTNHAAFGYLADKYNLKQVGISGLSTEEEPSPARIEEVHEIAKASKVTTIFYEQTVSPKVAETIASDLKLKTDVLDPVETLSDGSRGSDYVEVMKSNLESLRKANSCK